jgi:hypothetical protein
VWFADYVDGKGWWQTASMQCSSTSHRSGGAVKHAAPAHLLGRVLPGLGLQHLRVRLDLRPQLVRAQVAKQRLQAEH